MPDHARFFWRRLEMLVMAAACGTLLGTGLLAGVISFDSGDRATIPASDALSGAVFVEDHEGAYSARVVVDGVPLRMIVDTSTAQSRLSMQDAERLSFPLQESEVAKASYTASNVDIGGHRLHEMTLQISSTSPHSVIGLDWLARLGPVTFAPAPRQN